MGVFQDLVKIVNRCPWPLDVKFDGQTATLKPGENYIPRETLIYALNQNPLMGTQDPYNPNVGGAEYLVGIPEKANKYPCDPLTKDQIEAQKNCPSRYDYADMMSEKMGPKDSIELKGKKERTDHSQGRTPMMTEFGAGV